MPENPPYLTPQIEALVDAAIAAQFDSIRTATLPHMGGGMKGEHFAKEFCTLYVGGMRRIGATQALVGLMERYPDAMAIFPLPTPLILACTQNSKPQNPMPKCKASKISARNWTRPQVKRFSTLKTARLKTAS